MLPQTRPSSFHGVEQPFRLDVMHTFKTIQVYGWAALPNIPCHGPAHFAVLKNLFVVKLCRLSTTFKSTAGRAPQTRSSSFHGVKAFSRLDGMKLFKNIQRYQTVLCQTRPSSFYGVHQPFRLDVMAGNFVLPQHTAQFVEKSFRFDVMQIFNNV